MEVLDTVKEFRSARIVISWNMEIDAPADKIFPLLCPVREYDWIDPWKCKLIFSYSGFAELDCVFQTDFKSDGGMETWIVTRYEPNSLIQFVRTNPIRVIRYTISLKNNQDGSTTATWEQIITGLNEDGNKYVYQYSDEIFVNEMTNLEKMLKYYLKTSQKLKIEDLESYDL